ncbi:hypothetical protein KVR01_004641 [Diaporthe batatas]|uniref:uncharacterized protein n=1 Tax=Diaporthe batatas TaxID=748121 RepID=UPI001D04C513|nr:uncharacterized protein KVR01_004641 [Diaporthe batatas]KAG8166089.1 hypothetical protein KVR01_004641 [Diaporthe batatas]
MWRNAVSNREQRTNSQSTAQCSPSASDDIRPPLALSDPDAPPPSELSLDDFRLPSPLISDAGSLRLAVSAVNITSADHNDIVDDAHSRRDDGYFSRKTCSRASFSSRMAENGSTVCWASEQAVQWVVERERVLNSRVQEAVNAAEETLAELLQLESHLSNAGCQEVQDEVVNSMAQRAKPSLAAPGHGKVSFTIEKHPEDRDPMRPGTPGSNPIRVDGYFADDEDESPAALTRRKTRCSGRPSCPAPAPEMTEPLQSPGYVLRALKSSEIWDEDAPAEPVLHAPTPLRPVRELDLLLAGHDSTTEIGKELERVNKEEKWYPVFEK